MLINSNNGSFNLPVELLEPCVNHIATEYIQNNYKSLIELTKHYHKINSDKAYDLVSDMYTNLLEQENNGVGFNMNYFYEESGKEMRVEQFVRARIKAYAKNPKYWSDVVECVNVPVIKETTDYIEQIDSKGNTIKKKNGENRFTKKKCIEKENTTVYTVAATYIGTDDTDSYDEFQRAYCNAHVADSTEDIADMLSLREQIDYCIDICGIYDINIMNVFKNIDTLSELMGKHNKRSKKNLEGIFDKLSEVAEYHNELGETIMDILKFSSRNRSAFDIVLDTY